MMIAKALKVISNLVKFRGEQGEGQVSVTPAFS